MDALAHLALMAKAKAVFETDGTFLSFPALTPLSYKPDSLRFADAALPSAQQISMMSEFSRVANSLPTGTLFQPTPDHCLWDEYHTVLQTAVVASGDLSADQKAALAAAEAVLHVTTPDGLRTDSPTVTAYKQCRDAWFKAVQDYNTQKSTADASTDPAKQAQWTNTDEPLLRAAIDAANLDWSTQGNKAAVEAAQQQEATAAAESPGLRWQSWASQFVPDIDVLTDSNNLTFALTGFMPAGIVDQDDWPNFTMTAPEIAQLVATAPHELTAIFDAPTGTTGIDSLSFEYRSVAVTRPWFHPELFAARFWKLPPGAGPVSDGATPPSGDWPAYVTAVVFARNIVVHPHSAAGPAASVPLPAFVPINQRMQFIQRVDPATNKTVMVAVPAATPIAVRTTAPVLPPHPAVPVVRVAAPPRDAAHPTIAPAVVLRINPGMAGAVHGALPPHPPVAVPPHPPVAPPPHLPVAPPPHLPVAPPPHLPVAPPPPHLPVAPPPHLPVATPPPHPPIAPPPPTPVPASPPQPAAPPEISILAFICKRLPKSPDPDATLDWSS